MSRYIDADALLKDIETVCGPMQFGRHTARMCLMCIKRAPTVDVAPVVHGRWDDSFDGITPYCSVCGHSHRLMTRTPAYCPNCGARMDSEDKQ